MLKIKVIIVMTNMVIMMHEGYWYGKIQTDIKFENSAENNIITIH